MESMILGGMPLLPSAVEKVLPATLIDEVGRVAHGAVEELRLKCGRRAWMTCGGRNVILDTVLDRGQMEDILLAVCGGSLYAHAESIREGYVTLAGGVRVGVVGRAAVEDGRTVSVRDISSLCFRIPNGVRVDVSPLSALVRSFQRTRGLLVYSPPGGGKTTVLRCLARALGSGENPMRVVVVDTRGELEAGLSGRGLCVDILSGYPRRAGIEIAARSMGAEVIVCDEICGAEEARVIIETQGGGVPLVASAHASDMAGLLSRCCIARAPLALMFGWIDKPRLCLTLFLTTTRRRAHDGGASEGGGGGGGASEGGGGGGGFCLRRVSRERAWGTKAGGDGTACGIFAAVSGDSVGY